MANLRLVIRNFHDEATVSASTAAVDFPASNTQNDSRDSAWRSTSTATATYYGTFSRNRVINFFGMFLHRNHGSNIRFEGFSDAAWATPATGGDTGTVTINKVIGSSSDAAFAMGDDPYSIGQYDPMIVESPYWYYFPTLVTIQSYRVTLSSHVTTFWNDAFWHVSRFVVGKYWEPVINPSYEGFGIGIGDNTDVVRSRGGSLRADLGVSWKLMRMTLDSVSEIEAATWMQVLANSRRGKMIFASLFPGLGTLRERDSMGLFKFTSLNMLGRQVSRLTNTLQLEEL